MPNSLFAVQVGIVRHVFHTLAPHVRNTEMFQHMKWRYGRLRVQIVHLIVEEIFACSVQARPIVFLVIVHRCKNVVGVNFELRAPCTSKQVTHCLVTYCLRSFICKVQGCPHNIRQCTVQGDHVHCIHVQLLSQFTQKH